MIDRERLTETVAAQGHEAWRERWRCEHGDEPRLKRTEDRAWIAAHGSDQVDLAAAAFTELPADWQEENRRSAEVAVDAVLALADAGEALGAPQIERVAEVVHAAWLGRNRDGAPAQQKRPYAELDEGDKEKDRVVVRRAIAALKGEPR